MKLAPRLCLLATGTLLLAHYLPEGYWLLTAKPQRPPLVFYSCIEKRFLLSRVREGQLERTDLAGTRYEREEFERLLPLDNYLQLYKDSRMPKEIDGVAITPEKLRRERVNLRLKPEALDSPAAGLTPLFEAESGRVRLEVPEDVMRLGATIEFLDVKHNRRLDDKSARFQAAFKAAGFVFPVRLLGGNPSALKPYDEGYYLVDSRGEFFHLRLRRGAPDLVRLADRVPPEARAGWTALQPRFIHVLEQDNRELRALIIGRDNTAHLVVGPDYRLVPLPLKDYDPATMHLVVRGDLLNRLVTVSSSDRVEAVVLNRHYERVDRYAETLPARTASPAGRVAAALFPFTLSLESDTSGFLGFHFRRGGAWALGVNAAWLAGLAGWLAFRRRSLARRLPELLAVAVGGVFGLIAAGCLPAAAPARTERVAHGGE